MVAASYQPEHDESDGSIVAEINITPLTDVFLVLLVIFMVTTSVIHNQGKNIDLPGADVHDETPQGVITSYSIHYTKLYETERSSMRARG